MSSSKKPWWKTWIGTPAWMNIEARAWHGWAYGGSLLLVFAVLLVIAPTQYVVGQMVLFGVFGLGRAFSIWAAVPPPEA